MSDKDLKKSYLEAVYSIHHSGIYIHIDQLNEELDQILEDYQASSWAFITAWNPAGQLLSLEENLKRQIKLLLDIKDHILMEGQAHSLDHSWQEDSYLIIGISRKEALEICSKYGQAAFLFGEKGQKGELIFI